MDFILGRRLKFYTKETFKFFKIIVFAIIFILAIIFLKYKPVYGVVLNGDEIGYIEDITDFENEIKNNILEYKSKNIYEVNIKVEPEYKLKLVNKTQETNESDILIAMQSDAIIKYRYYDICINQEKVDSVDTFEQAEAIVSELKEKDDKIQLEIREQITENAEDVKTNDLETAKANLFEKFNIVEKDPIEIYVDGSSIVLKKFEPNCIFCGNTKNLFEYQGKLICKDCSKKIGNLKENKA